MSTQLEWALFYARVARGVIPIEHGSKKPTTCPPWYRDQPKWTLYECSEANVRRDFGSRPANAGLRLGDDAAVGRALVRIDFDWLEAQVIAKFLLPPTPWTMWRSDRRIPTGYFYWTDLKARKTTYNAPETPGDNRGRRVGEILANGQQSIVPPSLHPDGTRYSWITGDDIAALTAAGPIPYIPYEELQRLVNIIMGAALLAAHRGEGVLHDSAVAIAGGLLKDGMDAETVEKVIRGICEATGDRDVHDRVKAVSDTVIKLEAEEDVAGWGTLIDLLGETVVESAKRWFFPPRKRDKDLLVSSDYTDMGNRDRLVSEYGDQVRYVPQWGWVVWAGSHWERQEKEAVRVVNFAMLTVKKMMDAAWALPASDPSRDALIAHAFKSQDARAIGRMVSLARADQRVWARPEDFDSDPWLLNTQTGTVNLQTSEVHDHDKHDYITKVTRVGYVPEASAPRFREFLLQVCSDDPDTADYVLEALGMAVCGDTSEQAFFLCIGEGENGKSTLLWLIGKVLGGYAEVTRAETFDAEERSATSNDLAKLHGSRFVMAIEGERDRLLAEARVKSITGGDPITCRFLHHEWFTYDPQYTIFLAMNSKPVIRGTDHAIWRRVFVIPFLRKFTAETGRVRSLKFDLLSDEGEGILAELVRACAQWQHDGELRPSELVVSATSEYRDEMDTIKEFLNEWTSAKTGAFASSSDLYRTYSDWTKDRNERPLSSRSLQIELRRRGYRPEKRGGVRGWADIIIEYRTAFDKMTADQPPETPSAN